MSKPRSPGAHGVRTRALPPPVPDDLDSWDRGEWLPMIKITRRSWRQAFARCRQRCLMILVRLPPLVAICRSHGSVQARNHVQREWWHPLERCHRQAPADLSAGGWVCPPRSPGANDALTRALPPPAPGDLDSGEGWVSKPRSPGAHDASTRALPPPAPDDLDCWDRGRGLPMIKITRRSWRQAVARCRHQLLMILIAGIGASGCPQSRSPGADGGTHSLVAASGA